jgi:hypothetical protein
MQTETYANFLVLVKALAGVDNFTTDEESSILAFANRRIYQAYRESPLWPRYFVESEARPSTNDVIATTYDEVAGIRTSSSATRSGTTVTIVCTAAIDFVSGMSVTVSGLTGTDDPNVTAVVKTVDDATFTYDLTTNTTTSETYTGTATVSPVAIADIDTFHRVWAYEPFETNRSYQMDFSVSSAGARVTGNYLGVTGYYVGYKKQWGGRYTADSTDIPLEFFEYAAQATYADFLRMDQQTSRAITEEQVAVGLLEIELDQAERQANSAKYVRVSTHTSRATR